MASSREDTKVKEIEEKIRARKSTLQEIFPIWNSLDRKVKGLNLELELLEDERQKLTQGQMIFDGTVKF